MSLTTLNMQDFAGNLKSLVTDRPLLKPWFQVNLQEFVEVHAILIYRSVSKSAVFLSLTSVNKYSRIGHPHNVTTRSVTIYVCNFIAQSYRATYSKYHFTFSIFEEKF